MSRLPVNSAVLEWALADSGVSYTEAALLTGRSVEEVEKWLRPDGARPYKGDIEKLARRLGRSTQFFFLPEPPQTSPSTVQFRGAIEGQSDNPAAELKAVRRAAAIQKLARWSAEVRDLPPVLLPIAVPDPIKYANVMREHLGWTYKDQTLATSKSAAYKDLRSRIEQLGVAVLYLDAGKGNCRGFSTPDDLAPVIALNSAYNLASLKSYTLLHELAHLAQGTAAVCHTPNSDLEKWCDEFASAFLLPEQHLRDYFEYKGWSNVSVGQIDERVRLISNRYRASWQAVVVRLRQLGLAAQEVVDKVFDHSNEDSSGFSPDGGRTRPTIRLDEYGSTFTRAVIELRQGSRLSEFDARQQLGVNRSEFEQLRTLVSGAA
jgi:Zn-dependent peptidase ImmA (M78 family)